MRKTNFSNIGIRDETKKELEELKKRLCENYLSDATYDDLIRIFLKKNKKITLNQNELKELLLSQRGIKSVRWD
jgi:hypothetical protein